MASFNLCIKSKQEVTGPEKKSRRRRLDWLEQGETSGTVRPPGREENSRERERKQRERTRKEVKGEEGRQTKELQGQRRSEGGRSSVWGNQREEPVAWQPAQRSGGKRLFLSSQFLGSRLAAIPGARVTLPTPTERETL